MNKRTSSPSDIIYGIHPILELLRAKRRKIITIYTTKVPPKAWSQIKELLRTSPATQISFVSKDQLDRMAQNTDHQGFVAIVQPFPFRSKPVESNVQKIVLLLDGIQDPRNMGAILRSAYCTAVDAVIIPTKHTAPLNGVVFKSCAGLAEYMQIMLTSSAHAAAQTLKSAGYQLYSASFGGESIAKIQFQMPLCIIIGAEGTGVSSSLLNMSKIVTLPQRRDDISYNASVAAGIILFIIAQQAGRI